MFSVVSVSLLVDICYAGFCLVAAPYAVARAVSETGFRHALAARLWARYPQLRVPDRAALRIWIHGVSVGEVLASVPLVDGLRSSMPDTNGSATPRGSRDLIISSTTPAGVAVARRTYRDLPVMHFPFDFSGLVERALKTMRPGIIVLMEQELWPNMLEIAARRGIPVVILNGRMTARAFERYAYIRGLARTMFSRVALVCAIDAEHAERFVKCGMPPERVRVTGNMKYDALAAGLRTSGPEVATPASIEGAAAESALKYRTMFGVKPSELVIVAGSTHAPEEEWVLAAYARLAERIANLRLLIAPRHIDRVPDIERMVKAAGYGVIRRSAAAGMTSPRDVCLLDTVGELRSVYCAADVVFVGGSLIPHGGQNVLEPAVLGKPIVFGPSMFNFADAAALLVETGGAMQATCPEDLARALRVFVCDPDHARVAGAAGARAVSLRQGATARNIDAIFEIAAGGAPPRRVRAMVAQKN
ncbi:MAG: 3-deoxy-D-manno-octulosonic acid transferase [Planctomycetota bacterium]|nr:3-deoxy-D-manno-octulosonic acid transferase [Planctomycetota bacterium]